MTDMGRDTKTYPICNPYHGEEGPKWSRTFKPDFISGLGSVTDKFSSIAKHIVGKDIGGVQPFAPRFLDPAAVGPGAGVLVGCAPVVTRPHAGAASETRESRAARRWLCSDGYGTSGRSAAEVAKTRRIAWWRACG